MKQTLVREIKRDSNHQMDTIYKTVGKLQGGHYSTFRVQFKRYAFAFGWHPSIWDVDTPALTAGEQKDMDESTTEEGLRYQCDQKNAWLTIQHVVQGHPTENLLASLTMGDARESLATLHHFYHPKTNSGMQTAYQTLYSASMANTGKSIYQWVDAVGQWAAIVRVTGGEANETSQTVVLLKGLKFCPNSSPSV